MPKPTAGREYTIVSGDTLSHIAAAAYGDGTQWRRIWKANQTRLRSGDPDLIYPGEVIIIPGQAPELEAIERELSAGSLSGKDLDDFTLIIDGAEFPVVTGRVFRSMDNAADGWAATLARNLDDESQNTKLKPYRYLESLVYLGGQLAVRGALYTVAPKVSNQGITVDLEGWTFSADAIDSTIRPPYEENNVTLEQRAVSLCSALGIPVSFDGDSDAAFKRVTASPTDTIHSHLAKLASQRGYLLTSDGQGDLLLTRANTAGEPVGTLVEGLPPLADFEARFDGRTRFNSYRALTQTPKKNSISAVSKDTRVPKSRFLTFNAPDSTEGEIQKAADWKRSKQLAEALAIRVPVTSWYAPNGSLWAENTIVTLESPSLFVPDGFNFLIKSVEFIFEVAGTTATLELVPPQVYSGEEIAEPWFE